MSWSANVNPYYAPGTGAGMDTVAQLEPSRSPESESASGVSLQTVSPSTSGSDNLPDERRSSGSTSTSGSAIASTSSADQNKDKDKDKPSVPSACVPCRSKHLKCDGLQPCSRCLSNSFECHYVKSRRGFKGPRKNTNGLSRFNSAVTPVPTAQVPAPLQVPAPRACPLVRPNGGGAAAKASTNVNVPSGLLTPPEKMPLPSMDLSPYDIGQEMAKFDQKSEPGWDMREKCIEAFFYHFYPAHPFLLPRAEFMALRKVQPMKHLETAMRYVGSMYVEKAPTTALGLEAERAVYEIDCVDDGYRVQALLILTIGLDGYTFQEKALQILVDAQDLALKLGMNQRDYAIVHGKASVVLEESWRRTWWELYIVDGMIAGVHQKSSFRLNEIESSVSLPCEEREYITGVCFQSTPKRLRY